MKLLGLMALGLLGCTSGTPCKSFGGTLNETMSTFAAHECSDGAEYVVQCARRQPELTCTCGKGPIPGKRFTRAEPLPPVEPSAQAALDIVNPACGWNLRR